MDFQSCMSSFDVTFAVFLRRPDKRVARLIEKLGNEETVSQKKILCLNKVCFLLGLREHEKRLY